MLSVFGEHADEYLHSACNEHQTRIDFINPFFKALGWDMVNNYNNCGKYVAPNTLYDGYIRSASEYSDNKEKEQHNTIVAHVTNLIELKKMHNTPVLLSHRDQLQRAIEHTERKIDELVYGLYGLEEEIGMIENMLTNNTKVLCAI